MRVPLACSIRWVSLGVLVVAQLACGPDATGRLGEDETALNHRFAVTIDSPAAGASLQGSVAWTASVSNGTASKVEFLIDGKLSWTGTQAPFVFNGAPSGTLDTTQLANGTHSLAVSATSTTGRLASTSIQVNVANAATAPTGSAATFSTSLTQGMTITLPYAWSFTPASSQAVQGTFWADGKALATVSGPGPYSFTLSAGSLAAGAHVLGHSWDLADGTHQSGPQAYSVTVASSTTGGTTSSKWTGPWRDASYVMPTTFTKTITSASAFKSLVGASGTLVEGDVVHVVGPMTLDGCPGCHTLILKKLASPGASIYFDSNVVFAGDTNTSQGFAAVYLDATNLSLYGGVIAGGQAGDGLRVGPGFSADTVDVSHVRWWGLKIHDVGAAGIYVGGIKNTAGAWVGVRYADLDAEVWAVGQQPQLDPHTVKGTGLHALYTGGCSQDPPLGVSVSNSKFSIYTHDTTACVGDVQAGQSIQDSELWIRAERLSFMSGTLGWSAARAFTPWTAASSPYTVRNLTVHTVEAYDLSGPVVFTGSLGSGPVVVEYGRGTRVLTNSTAYSYQSGNPYMPNSNITYQDVAP